MIDWKTGWSKCSDEEKLQRAQIVVDIYDRAYVPFEHGLSPEWRRLMKDWLDVSTAAIHDGDRTRTMLMYRIKKRDDIQEAGRLALKLERFARILELFAAHAELL